MQQQKPRIVIIDNIHYEPVDVLKGRQIKIDLQTRLIRNLRAQVKQLREAIVAHRANYFVTGGNVHERDRELWRVIDA